MSVIKVSSKSGSATRGAQKTIRAEPQGGTQTYDIISSITRQCWWWGMLTRVKKDIKYVRREGREGCDFPACFQAAETLSHPSL